MLSEMGLMPTSEGPLPLVEGAASRGRLDEEWAGTARGDIAAAEETIDADNEGGLGAVGTRGGVLDEEVRTPEECGDVVVEESGVPGKKPAQ